MGLKRLRLDSFVPLRHQLNAAFNERLVAVHDERFVSVTKSRQRQAATGAAGEGSEGMNNELPLFRVYLYKGDQEHIAYLHAVPRVGEHVEVQEIDGPTGRRTTKVAGRVTDVWHIACGYYPVIEVRLE